MNSLTFKAVNVMPFTQDVTNQISQPEIDDIVTKLKSIYVTHIGIQIPLDSTEAYTLKGQKLTYPIEEYLKMWCDSIHNAGLNVIFRGTFNGIVNANNWGYEKEVQLGTPTTAPTDGGKTWLGKVYQWLQTNGKNILEGDVLALLPEPTLTAFNGNFFISAVPDVKENFLNFFVDLHTIEANYIEENKINNVYISMTAQTVAELQSEWIPLQLIDLPSILNIDYFNVSDDAETLKSSLYSLQTQYHLPVFVQEWSDIRSDEDVAEKFAVFEELIDNNALIGLGYSCGFTGAPDDVLRKDEKGEWQVTTRGVLLGKLFLYGVEVTPDPKQDIAKAVQNNDTVTTPQVNGEGHTHTHEPVKMYFGLTGFDVPFLTIVAFSGLIASALTVLTYMFLRMDFNIFTPYVTVIYTVLVALVSAILDGR